jgi:hypothetical protein
MIGGHRSSTPTIVDIIMADITVVGVTMAAEPLDFETGRG